MTIERGGEDRDYGSRGRATSDRQPRANRDERCAALLRLAADQVLDLGGFPISYERLAREAGVSKALIYNYFPNQYDLGRRLIADALDRVDRRALRRAIGHPDPRRAARDCALIYFDLIVKTGPLLHILLADAYLHRGPDRAILTTAALLLLPIARRVRRTLALSPREATVVMHLLLTLPEEAGRKVYRKEANAALARAQCGDTVEASIEALISGTTAATHAFAQPSDFL